MFYDPERSNTTAGCCYHCPSDIRYTDPGGLKITPLWKHNRVRVIQKAKIMASGPITSWQIHGGPVETATDFIFLGSRITVDADCSHEIKRHLLLGRKAMTNLDSVLKSRDITLPTKVLVAKAVVFFSSHV